MLFGDQLDQALRLTFFEARRDADVLLFSLLILVDGFLDTRSGIRGI